MSKQTKKETRLVIALADGVYFCGGFRVWSDIGVSNDDYYETEDVLKATEVYRQYNDVPTVYPKLLENIKRAYSETNCNNPYYVEVEVVTTYSSKKVSKK